MLPHCPALLCHVPGWASTALPCLASSPPQASAWRGCQWSQCTARCCWPGAELSCFACSLLGGASGARVAGTWLCAPLPSNLIGAALCTSLASLNKRFLLLLVPAPRSAARWDARRRRWLRWPWCRQTWCSTCRGALGRPASPAICMGLLLREWRCQRVASSSFQAHLPCHSCCLCHVPPVPPSPAAASGKKQQRRTPGSAAGRATTSLCCPCSRRTMTSASKLEGTAGMGMCATGEFGRCSSDCVTLNWANPRLPGPPSAWRRKGHERASWCRAHFINPRAMRKAVDIHAQVRLLAPGFQAPAGCLTGTS